MRAVVIALAGLALFVGVGSAASADPPPVPAVVVPLPDSQDNFHLYLFTLKRNGIIYTHSGQNFCAAMHYGRAIVAHPASAGSGNDVVPDGLEWVICGFKNQ
jgi:hypothetical protein